MSYHCKEAPSKDIGDEDEGHSDSQAERHAHPKEVFDAEHEPVTIVSKGRQHHDSYQESLEKRRRKHLKHLTWNYLKCI